MPRKVSLANQINNAKDKILVVSKTKNYRGFEFSKTILTVKCMIYDVFFYNNWNDRQILKLNT